MHTVGPQIWQDNRKCEKWKTHTLRHEMWQGKLKKLENEKCPRKDMEYGKKTENHGKWETHSWGLKIDEITEKREKWESTLKDLEYGEKTEHQRKWV